MRTNRREIFQNDKIVGEKNLLGTCACVFVLYKARLSMTINFLSRNQFVVLGQMDEAIKFQCAATMVILMLMKNLLFMEFPH